MKLRKLKEKISLTLVLSIILCTKCQKHKQQNQEYINATFSNKSLLDNSGNNQWQTTIVFFSFLLSLCKNSCIYKEQFCVLSSFLTNIPLWSSLVLSIMVPTASPFQVCIMTSLCGSLWQGPYDYF